MASQPAPLEDLDEERRWVEAAKAGNLDAMRPIFDKYSGALYSAVIMPKLGDPAAAEDVLRDTLATAITKLDQFTWTGKSIFVWLRQIAINKTYDLHRKRKRNLKLADAMAKEAQTLDSGGQGVDALLIEQEEREANRERIGSALSTINDRYACAIRLRLVEELPRDECAEQMGVSVSTFDVVLFRAVRAFRKQFGDR